jgi:hypothetical protein
MTSDKPQWGQQRDNIEQDPSKEKTTKITKPILVQG